MIKYFWSHNGEVVATVYDHANQSSMILRRLESFEELKSKINFLILFRLQSYYIKRYLKVFINIKLVIICMGNDIEIK